VLVWIHGGGFLFGTGADPTFTATTHVNRSEIVVVTINYRLMAFGFINTPGDDGFAGNYGLQDQQLALKWIQSNIKAFGGDPSQVTISGQSAGAMSSSLHMLMPSSKGLFSSAIIQSNPWGQRYRTPEENLSYADKLAEHLGCSDSTNVTCLQSVPMDDLIKASGTQSYEVGLPLSTLMFLPWMPAVESAMIEKQPLDMIAEGNYDKTIPFLIGTTANESAYFIPPLNVNALEYKLVVDAIFTKDAKAVLEQYPAEGNLNKLFIDLITDYLFFCPVRWVTTLLADNDNVRMYQFLHAPEHDPRGLEKCVGYSCHGADLAYAFHSTKNVNGTWSAEERTLSNMMSSRWGVFVNSGKTPGSGWPLYNIDSNTSLTFDLDSQGQATEELVTNYRGAFCNFWDTIGYTF
jgi:carboxylesterase type B